MFVFDNSYAGLPARFYARLSPTPVRAAELLLLNTKLAGELGIDADLLASHDGVLMLSGDAVPKGAEPLAMAYAGHQFGRFVPKLGDGRAILLGEIIGGDGVRYDIQLKGSGPTPFSRNGDGRAALGPVLREYIVSETMAALGLPTTRALAAVATGEEVCRDSILPGAVLTRVAKGLVRVGTFEYFAAREDFDGVRALADYVIARHYPNVRDASNPYLALLEAVVAAQASLVARWMHIGFIHGVMNTDNMSVAGETIDYGPCAFMDDFHPGTVYSSIDRHGRYAYGNQPRIAQWNLAVLAQSMLPLLGENEEDAVAAARAAVDSFAGLYRVSWLTGMRGKLGLMQERDGDEALAHELLQVMTKDSLDFTNTFRRLCQLVVPGDALTSGEMEFEAFSGWLAKWRLRLGEESIPDDVRVSAMLSRNPAFIPRNHRIEHVLSAAVKGDLEPLKTLMRVLSKPYETQPDFAEFANPPRPEQVVQATFCGT